MSITNYITPPPTKSNDELQQPDNKQVVLVEDNGMVTSPITVVALDTSEQWQKTVIRIISLAKTRQQDATVIVIISHNSDIPKSIVIQLLNIAGIIVMFGDIPTASLATAESRQFALWVHVATVFPNTCLLLVSTESQRYTVPEWKRLREFSRFRSFADGCTLPVHFASEIPDPLSSRTSALLLPPQHQIGLSARDILVRSPHCVYNAHIIAQELLPTRCSSLVLRPGRDLFELVSTRSDPKCVLTHVRRSIPISKYVVVPQLNHSTRADTICFALPYRTRGNFTLVSNSIFVTTTLPSIRVTMNRETPMRLYVGVEESDVGVQTAHQRRDLAHAMLSALRDRDEVVIATFPHMDEDIVYIWNTLFLAAFDDGCEWLFHITDDVDFLHTKGVGWNWDNKFKSLLRHSGGLGAIGKANGKTSQSLNTMPFVTRKHFEIFGTFYPGQTHNVLSDASLFFLYRAHHMLVGPNGLGHWINLSDGNHTDDEGLQRQYSECEWSVSDAPPFYADWKDFSSKHVLTYVNEVLNGVLPVMDPPMVFPRAHHPNPKFDVAVSALSLAKQEEENDRKSPSPTPSAPPSLYQQMFWRFVIGFFVTFFTLFSLGCLVIAVVDLFRREAMMEDALETAFQKVTTNARKNKTKQQQQQQQQNG